MLWTAWVPIPRIYVKRNHRKLLAELLQPLTVLLFLIPTSRGQHSRSSLARCKERHKANQHPKEPACRSCATSTVASQRQSQSSGLSVVYCSSARTQTSTPSRDPLNCFHHLHRELTATGVGLVIWKQTNSRTRKARFCKQVGALKHRVGKNIF